MLDLSPLFDRAANAVSAFADSAKHTPAATSAAVRLVEVLGPWRDARNAARERLKLLNQDHANIDATLFNGAMAPLHNPTLVAAVAGLEKLEALSRALDQATFEALSPDGTLDATRIDVATRAWRSITEAADAILCAGQMAHTVMGPRSSLITVKAWTTPFIRTGPRDTPSP